HLTLHSLPTRRSSDLAAKTLTKDGVYGLSFPCGSNDFQATNFLNFYVRSGGGSLLNDDLTANLTSDLAIDGINYWLKVYNDCSRSEEHTSELQSRFDL